MKKILAILLTVAMLFTVAAFSASAADTVVAAIGEATYATLTDAIADAKAGDTVTLLADVTENVTIGKNITLDGADYDYTGTVTISGKVSVTIQNVDFVNGNIYKNKKTGVGGNYTVKGCDFDGQGMNNYAINLGGTNNIVIENCTAKNYGYGFLQVPASNVSVSVKDVEVSNVNYGFKIDYSNGVIMENVIVKDAAYGIVDSNYGKKTYKIKNCEFDAAKPVYIWERNTTVITTFELKGTNYVGDDLTFGSELVKVVADVAKIGSETYATIGEAVAAAKDGDVITVIVDHTLANDKVGAAVSGMYPFVSVTDKKITIDLNGKTITANPSLDANMLAVFYAGGTGELTLKDSSETQSGTVAVTMADGTQAYSMFSALGTSKMYIESGNYSIDKVEYGQSMIYAGQDKQLFVSGGNFCLGNAKTKPASNGEMQPWIYNAHGDGVKAITVTGGTYNVDPTHYHGEAYFPDCYTPVEEADKWTVKIVHTPGEAANCMVPQTCTVCSVELASVTDHVLGEYVSDGNATCTTDGTKTAECVYGCGATDTVVDEGSKGTHNDADNDGNCDGCDAEFCESCGKIHSDWMSLLFCAIVDFIKLVISFISSVK